MCSKRLIIYFLAFVIMLLCTETSIAHIFKKGRNKKDFKLIEAYTQRTLPGRRQGRVNTATHFIIKWDQSTSPLQFYWIEDSAAIPCSIIRVHKAFVNGKFRAPGGLEYLSDNTPLSNIAIGDTLDICAQPDHGDNNIKDLPTASQHTLIYKYGNQKWRTFAVSVLSRKPDIAMP